ncbi:MAG TPA: AAA family ATPase [Solirubrobacteraceae bacterium]|jgi:DNA-binding CsgD family transcriptional regulator
MHTTTGRGAHGLAARLLERDGELDALTRAWAQAARGEGKVIVIEAPAGVGKSALLHELQRLASDAAFVLRARGTELERGFAFGLVRRMLDRPLAALPVTERDSLFEGAAELAGMVLASHDPAASAPAGDQSFAALHGLYWLLANLSDGGSVLVSVDDVHWSDEASLRFLAYLAARVEGLPVCLAVALRPHETTYDPALLEALTTGAVRLRPSALSETASVQLVRETIPGATDAVCVACHEATRGNPFYLKELVNELGGKGGDETGLGIETIRALSPDTIGRAVLARLARMGPEAIAVAQAVATLTEEAELTTVASLARLDAQRVAVLLDDLAEAELVSSGKRLDFVHPVVRAVVEESIRPAERRLAHARAAAVLLETDASLERVAMHLLAAEAGVVPGGSRVLLSAAAEGVSRGAPETAVSYLSRALEEHLGDPDRAEVLDALGHARLAMIDPQGIDDLLEALALTPEPPARASRALAAARRIGTIGLLDAGLEACRTVLDGDRDTSDGVAPELLGRLLSEAIGCALVNPANADLVPHYREWLASIEAGEVRPLQDIHEAAAAVGSGVPATQISIIVDRALAGGLLGEEGSVPAGAASLCLIWCDRIEPVAALMTGVLDMGRRNGSALIVSFALMYRAMARARAGDLAAVEDDTGYVVAANLRDPRLAPIPYSPALLVESLVEQGRIADAHEVLDQTGLARATPDSWAHALLLASRARLHVTEGELEPAVADLRGVGSVMTTIGWGNPACCPWRSQLALALAALGETDEAGELADEELELARGFGANRALGIALRAAALVRGADLAMLRESAAVLERSPARLELARTLVELGRATRHAGERSVARELLARGLDLADRCGAAPLVDDARQELRIAGARPRRARLSGAASLTASERRVADLAASGMTNRQIAQALFVTTRTVATHLTHIYQKLDLAGRDQLQDALSSPE